LRFEEDLNISQLKLQPVKPSPKKPRPQEPPEPQIAPEEASAALATLAENLRQGKTINPHEILKEATSRSQDQARLTPRNN